MSIGSTLMGAVLTLDSGPWAGKQVRVVGTTFPPSGKGKIPAEYCTLKRLDTGEIGHRLSVLVMLLAAEQGYFGRRNPGAPAT